MTEYDNNFNEQNENGLNGENTESAEAASAAEDTVQNAGGFPDAEEPQMTQYTEEQQIREPSQNAVPPYHQTEQPQQPYHQTEQVQQSEQPRTPDNGYYQQNPYYNRSQQPYAPQNQQGYPQQPSQGYYRPETNEYVYSPAPQKKKGGAGKAAIVAIVAALSLFVVSIFAVAAVDFAKSIANPQSSTTLPRDDHNITDNRDYHDKKTPLDKNDDKKELPDESEEIDDEKTTPAASVDPEPIRDFPTIEQLSTPTDAMPLPDIYDKLSRSVVGISCAVRGGRQTGTGFIISEDGYIVTNAHVISGATSIMIVDGEQKEYNAEVIGSDTSTDIAVLRIDPDEIDLYPVELGKSGDLRIGELTIAIGNPLGFDLYGTMTTGIVSGLNRSVTIDDNTMNLLQTSASINHGNSGGPLIDAYGRVIGITSAKIDSTYGEGLGFAIPIDEAIPIIENLIRYGYVTGRPSIGISGQDISDMMSLFYNMPKGVYVFVVEEGSGADKAGIIPGDLIIGIEGETIENTDQLNAIKNRFAVGDTVTLTIYRKGQNFDVSVELTEARRSN